MEGIKGGGGRVDVGVGVGVGEDDIGDGMQCSYHPYRNNPGGICAFCLQDKLGKLVSSSLPLPIHASSSSSSSPSFRSDIASSSTTRPTYATSTTATSSLSSSLLLSAPPTSTKTNGYTRRTRLPFLSAKKKKKKDSVNSSSSASAATSNITLKRSKSTATPRRGHSFAGADDRIAIQDFSPRKRNGFWSFLHLSSKSSASTKKFNSKSFRDSNGAPTISTISASASATTSLTSPKPRDKCCPGSLGRKSGIVVEEDNSNTNTTASASSVERKVSRSRSVGCGSRSFSGDFFERISTGFGDCTLRRVESQREGKHKVVAAGATMNRGGDNHHHRHCMKERVRCGGLFSGFMVTSSSSSSSSSSYLVSSSADDTMNGKPTGVALSHGRARSWGWAFASPLRAFSTKPSSKENRRDIIRDANDNATPNLSAIPSLLAVRG